ncbi:R3H domain-containing protein 4-like [Liolophura sinensis]|uniref:R3H domain-containing protein 4-like n=1 Tax=Liolophura sinensis TaxID=3198878 RepID=UPI0031593D37
MGVTRNNRELFFNGLIDDQLELSPEEAEEETAAQEQKPKKHGKSRSRSYKMRDYTDVHSMDTGGRRKLNVKQARRVENLRSILGLVEKEDLEFDLSSIFEPSMSVFAELFMEREKMKAWNNFLNSSEEEQQAIIREGSGRRAMKKMTVEGKSSSDNSERLSNDKWEEIPDSRAGHPAFSAEECFARIDAKFRTLLRKRHLPKGTLAGLEADVVSFFSEWPSSVYVSEIPSSYERMLLHALCQYLDLSSRSYDHEEVRLTQVENKHETFNAPDVPLTQYIEELS